MTPTSRYVLDTNMVTYLVSDRSPASRRAFLAAQPQAMIAVSAVTQAEVFLGLEKRPEATRLRSTMEEFFASMQILAWDSAAAHAYGNLRAQLNASGRSLALMDLLIASHTIAAGPFL